MTMLTIVHCFTKPTFLSSVSKISASVMNIYEKDAILKYGTAFVISSKALVKIAITAWGTNIEQQKKTAITGRLKANM